MGQRKPYPQCPSCPAYVDFKSSKDVRREGYKVITDMRELAALGQDRLLNVRLKHAMREDDIIAEYKVPEDVDCSYGHPHKGGVVANTACKARLFLGIRCARKLVLGFEAATARLNRTRVYINHKAVLARSPELGTRLARLEKELEPLFQLRSDIGAEPLIVECRKRAGGQIRDAEVDVPVDVPPNERPKFDRRRLSGLELWNRDVYSRPALKDTQQSAVALMAELRRHGDDLSPTAARRLSARHGVVDKQIKVFEDLWDVVAERFFSEHNLAIAAYAALGSRVSTNDLRAAVARARKAFEGARRERDQIIAARRS
jgi:hypothetical protein